MAIGVIWRPAVDQQAYDAVRNRVLEAGQAGGMRFHAGGESPGGWRIFEVWDSQEALDRFMEETLHPAVAELGGGQVPAPVPDEVFDIYFQAP
jgi:hypothetical protein